MKNKSDKDKYCMLSLIHESQKNETHEYNKKNRLTDIENKPVGKEGRAR